MLLIFSQNMLVLPLVFTFRNFFVNQTKYGHIAIDYNSALQKCILQ